MAECYLRKNDLDLPKPSISPMIRGINTTVFPQGSPTVPIMNLLMREREPHSKATDIKDLDPTANRFSKCEFNVLPECNTWQCAYLREHPDAWPPPTSSNIIRDDTEAMQPPKQLNKLLLSRKDIDREVARQKILGFYGGLYDLETICSSYHKKRPSKKAEPEPESTSEEPEQEPESEPPTLTESEDIPPSKQSVPARPILKKKQPVPSTKRTPKPYQLPPTKMSPIAAVNFFPGKPKLVQRYREKEMNRAMRKRPIAEEADSRFSLTETSSHSSITRSL